MNQNVVSGTNFKPSLLDLNNRAIVVIEMFETVNSINDINYLIKCSREGKVFQTEKNEYVCQTC